MRIQRFSRLLPSLLIAAFLFFSLGNLSTAEAQPQGRNVGLGGQIGSPSGVTLKMATPGRAFAWDFLAAWDLGDFFFLNMHGNFQEWVDPETNVGFYYGPGGFVGFYERRNDTDAVFGLSVMGGVNLFVERFEFFAQIMPQLEVIPSTDGHFRGGVGLRYYF